MNLYDIKLTRLSEGVIFLTEYLNPIIIKDNFIFGNDIIAFEKQTDSIYINNDVHLALLMAYSFDIDTITCYTDFLENVIGWCVNGAEFQFRIR